MNAKIPTPMEELAPYPLPPTLQSEPLPAVPIGAQQSTSSPYTGPTYYQREVVKPSGYGALVWGYTWVAGLGGSAQVIATLADLSGRSRYASLVRHARYLASGASLVGPALLIADLHTPKRWYNMLRIFRSTSPMSIGSYILTSFSTFTGLTAIAEFFRSPRRPWTRRLARAAQPPAGLTGVGMSIYTGSLISATSSPAWAAQPRLISARFACSAMASAAAALSLSQRLWGDARNCERLDGIALVATLAGTALSSASERDYQAEGLDGTMKKDSATATFMDLSESLGHMLPLLCLGLAGLGPKKARGLGALASLGILAGGMMMRAGIFRAGNESAKRPQDYFQFTRPERLPASEADSHGDA
jgi:formate-dependent nitrite reductase membrane component NrfD